MADGERPDRGARGFVLRAWNSFTTSGLELDPTSPLLRRVMFLNYYLLTTVFACLVFGAFNLAKGRMSGVVELAVGFIGVLMILLIRKTIAVNVAQVMTLLYALPLMVFLLFDGGIEGTGLYWWFCIPPGAFFLMGGRVGWWWTGATVAIFLADMGLNAAGILSGPYSVVQLRQFTASYLALCLIMYFYEMVRKDHEEIIESRTAELQAANENLKREVAARLLAQGALESAKGEADQANAAKSEFLSRMSHELRTPMNSILGFSQLLQMDPREPLTMSQKESVEHIISSGHHLLSLINEVLDLSRIEAGCISLNPQKMDLKPLVSECLGLVKPLAQERKVTLRDDTAEGADLRVTADPRRLKQVLLNLLSNAIKYNRAEGLVRVQASADGPTAVRLSVTDSGMGMPEDQLAHLFEPFQRLAAEHTSIEGTGIGLTISKKIMEMMGGSITVKSTPGLGSCFTLQLPCVGDGAPAGTQTAPAHVEEKADGGGTVLYIEDDPANLTLVRHILSRRPEVKLLLASTGMEGLALARAREPDLILLDIHLPDLDGREVLKYIRAGPGTRGIPVVIVSASAMPREVEKLQEDGVEGYLTKPLDIPRFLETIDEHLGRTHGASADPAKGGRP